jgi:hypothetical protein
VADGHGSAASPGARVVCTNVVHVP